MTSINNYGIMVGMKERGTMSSREKNRAGGVVRARGVTTREGGVIVRGPWAPDLTQFKTTTDIMGRGLKLLYEGRVRELALFPGVFHVTGETKDADGRVHVYTVDVRERGKPTCGCEYFQHRVQVCKHIAAVGAWYVGKDEKEIKDALGRMN